MTCSTAYPAAAAWDATLDWGPEISTRIRPRGGSHACNCAATTARWNRQ